MNLKKDEQLEHNMIQGSRLFPCLALENLQEVRMLHNMNSKLQLYFIEAKNGSFKDMMTSREVRIRVEMPKF